MDASRREFISGTAAVAFAPGASLASDGVTPEAFGARGDGRTNDTEAFAALSSYINQQGGGTIVLRPVTYVVGKQRAARNAAQWQLPRWTFPPADILHFANCVRPLVIRGNGATLRAASGLRFGTFDPQTDNPFHHPMPFYKREYVAVPYDGMIVVEHCSGIVDISDIELDGNLLGLLVGGQFGDAGWQVPAYGLKLIGNSGSERLLNIHSHHHACDGLIIKGLSERRSSSRISSVRCEYNGRQGCTISSGQNYDFEHCRFAHSGKGGLGSRPMAGVDLEAEPRSTIRRMGFLSCEFLDNRGAGLAADSGDTEDVSFDDCRFVGTTSWTAWPRKPRMTFSNCTFIGAMVHPFGDPNPARAARFVACSFLDDPALSPTGNLYLGPSLAKPIVNAPSAENALFDTCRFHLIKEGLLPFTRDVIYSDCIMSQRSPIRSHPGGIYFGTDRLSGNIDLSGATIGGNVTLNGRALPRTV